MTSAPDQDLRIRTPDGVAFVIPVAGVVSRFLAWGLDACLAAVLSIALSLVLSAFALVSATLAQTLGVVAFFLLQSGYSMAFEAFWRGQTPGKRALGLRVVDVRGLRLMPTQVVLRNLLRPIDALPVAYLVGGLAALLSRHGQRLGDLAAGTTVTTVRRRLAPSYTALAGGGPNSLRSQPHLAARLRQRVSPAQAAAALEALLRRDLLDPSARVVLFAALAREFKDLVPFPPESVEGLTDEAYVRAAVDLLHRSGPDPAPTPAPPAVRSASA